MLSPPLVEAFFWRVKDGGGRGDEVSETLLEGKSYTVLLLQLSLTLSVSDPAQSNKKQTNAVPGSVQGTGCYLSCQ